MNTQIIYNNKNAEKKKALVEEINGLMGIPSSGLCVLFATEDNFNNPSKPYDDYYSKQGFYMNVDIDGLPHPWPDEVNGIPGRFRKHFIWISKRICADDKIHFTWIYIHELQHLKQSLNNPFLLIVASLFEHLSCWNVREVDIPTEYDCERKAKELAIGIFGEKECISYLSRMKSADAANDRRYSKLLAINIMEEFDVERAVQQHVLMNKADLLDIQKKMCDLSYTKWNIDIEKICSLENAHEAIISAVKKIM